MKGNPILLLKPEFPKKTLSGGLWEGTPRSQVVTGYTFRRIRLSVLNPDFAIQFFNTEHTELKRVLQGKLFSYSVLNSIPTAKFGFNFA
jgi:hypothetical protein